MLKPATACEPTPWHSRPLCSPNCFRALEHFSEMPIVGLADCLANTLTPHVSGEVASQKLRDAFDAFSCTVKEMSIVRAYCVRSSESTTCQTCQQTKLPQQLLQKFVSKHQVACQASWRASELELELGPEGVFIVKDFALTNATTFFWEPIREIINGKISCGDLARKLSVLSSISEGLGRLLSPFADDLLPKIEHGVRNLGEGLQLQSRYGEHSALW